MKFKTKINPKKKKKEKKSSKKRQKIFINLIITKKIFKFLLLKISFNNFTKIKYKLLTFG